MRDWRRIVCENLRKSRLKAGDQAELVAELASHLEELYECLRADGLPEVEAFERCMSQLLEAQIAARDFDRAKCKEGGMNYRSKTLWLPGLVTLTLASVSLMVMQVFAFSRPRVYWVDGVNVEVGLFWLLSLVPCGALGAYMSCRAGGTRWNSILASLFPSLTMLGVFCVVLPIAVFIERNTYVIHHLRPFGLALLAWTVVPGAVLLLGALPVLWKMNNRGHSDATPHIA